jgi:regulatory protein
MENKKLKSWTKEEALVNLKRQCAAQERCHSEIRTKLLERQVYGDDLEEIISTLILDGFLNEENFAKAYARGKFRMKGWGKIKIRMHLKMKSVTPYCINSGIEEIDDEEYHAKLLEICTKKWHSIYEKNSYIKKQKVYSYLLGRGFEDFMIKEVLEEINQAD